jgi:hypothetical protein
LCDAGAGIKLEDGGERICAMPVGAASEHGDRPEGEARSGGIN